MVHSYIGVFQERLKKYPKEYRRKSNCRFCNLQNKTCHYSSPKYTLYSGGEEDMQKIVPELIGKKIREEREKRGLLQKDLAERLYVAASVISRMEKGKNIDNLEKLVLVANSLNIDVLELIAAGVKITPEQKQRKQR